MLMPLFVVVSGFVRTLCSSSCLARTREQAYGEKRAVCERGRDRWRFRLLLLLPRSAAASSGDAHGPRPATKSPALTLLSRPSTLDCHSACGSHGDQSHERPAAGLTSSRSDQVILRHLPYYPHVLSSLYHFSRLRSSLLFSPSPCRPEQWTRRQTDFGSFCISM